MQIKIFTIPIYDGYRQEEDMNVFLRSRKIISVEKQFVQSESPAWSFCVAYIENYSTPVSQQNNPSKEKIDYRDVLDEQTFAKYAKLREARKQIAAEEVIPAYSVFTNEELAKIAGLDNLELGKMVQIEGIGAKRVEKYENRLLQLYQKLSQEK